MAVSRRFAAMLGIAAVALFGAALVVFTRLNPGFDAWRDVVSTLGAVGQPYAMWWNLIGFAAVGALFVAYGLAYGQVVGDRAIGVLLASFGVGFGTTSVPFDLADASAALSRAHVVAVTLGLAAWMLGLARIAQLPSIDARSRVVANVAAVLVVVPILGQAAQLWPMPITHRLVFVVVFGWVLATSVLMLRGAGPVRAAERSPA